MPSMGDALKLSIVITSVDRFSRTFDTINRKVESMAFVLNNKIGRAITQLEKSASASGKNGQKLMAALASSFRETHEEINRLLDNAGKLDMLGTTMTRIGIAAGVAVGGIVNLAAGLEDKMARVRAISYNPFADEAYQMEYEKNMDELDKYVRTLALTTPIKTEQLADLAIVVAQLGLTGKDMTTFMDTVAKVASIDEHLSPERWAEYLAKFRQTFDLATEDMDDFASMLTHLATSTPAHAGEIAEAMFRTGKIAEGLSAQDIATVNTALIQVGMTAERAGTATRRLFIDLADVNKMRKIIAFLDYDYDFAAFEALKDSAPDAGSVTKGLYSLGNAVPEDKLQEYQTMFIKDPLLLLAEVLGQFAKKSEEQMAKLGGDVSFFEYFQEGELNDMKNFFEGIGDIIGNEDIGAPIESVLRDIFNIRGTEAVQKLKTQVEALLEIRDLAYQAWPTPETTAASVSRAISMALDKTKMADDELEFLSNQVDAVLNAALKSGLLETKEGFKKVWGEILEVATIPEIDASKLDASLKMLYDKYDISLLQEKYGIRTESMAAQMTMARNAIVSLLYQIGIALKPMVQDLTKFVSRIATWFSNMPPMFQTFIAKGLVFAAVFGVIGGMALKMIALIMRIKALIMARDLAKRIGLIGKKDGLLYQIGKALGAIKLKAASAFKWAKTFGSEVASGAKTVWKFIPKLPSVLSKGITRLWGGLKNYAQMYINALGTLLGKAAGILYQFAIGIGSFVGKLTHAVVIKLAKLFAPIKAIGVVAFGYIKAGILGMWKAVSFVFSLMMAHPVVLVFAAIAAAIVGIIALVKNWGKVTEWIGKMFNGLKNTFRSVADFFKFLFSPIQAFANGLTTQFDELDKRRDEFVSKVALQDFNDLIVSAVIVPTDADRIINALGEETYSKLAALYDSMGNRLKGAFETDLMKILADHILDNKPLTDDALAKITESMMEFLPQSPAKKGPLTKLEEAGRKIVEILGENILKAKNKAQDAMEAVGESITSTLDKTLNSRTADVLSKFFKQLGMGGAIDQINKVLATIYNLQDSDLGNSINEVTDGLLGNITGGIQAILSGKIGDLSGIITTFGTAIGADLTGLAAALGPIGIAIAAITTAFALFGDQQWFQDLTGPIVEHFKGIWEWVTNLFAPIGDMLAGIMPTLGKILLYILKSTSILSPLFAGLRIVFSVVFAVLKKIGEVAKDIFDPISKQFKQIRETFREAFEPLREAFNAVWEAFKPLIDFGLESFVKVVLFPLKLMAIILTPIVKALAWVIEKISSFFRAIADFIKGIANTIENVVNKFTEREPWWKRWFEPKEETTPTTNLVENGTSNFDSFKTTVGEKKDTSTKSSGAMNQNNTFNIQSSDPEKVWRFIERKLDLEALKSR